MSQERPKGQLQTANAKKAKALVRKARSFLSVDRTRAFELLNRAMQTDPTIEAECSAMRGIALWQNSEFEIAVSHFRSAVTLKPLDRKLSVYLFENFLGFGERMRAINESARFLKAHEASGARHTRSIAKYLDRFYETVMDWIEEDDQNIIELQKMISREEPTRASLLNTHNFMEEFRMI